MLALQRLRFRCDRLQGEARTIGAEVWGTGVVVSQCGILRRSLRASFALAAALALAFAVVPAALAQIVVSNTASSGAGSLAAAITAANASPGSTITFSLPANSTLTLTGPLPAINANVTIDGSGAAGLTISGGNSSRVFFVLGGNATIENIPGELTTCGFRSLRVDETKV